MKRYKNLIVGKSRSLKKGKLETWIKAELMVEIDSEELTVEDVEETIADVDAILDKEEQSERERWNEIENKFREQQNRRNS